jgi:hypothetical protein
MKLLTYDAGSGPRCGALQDEYVADVSALLGTAQTLRDVRTLLETGASAIERVREALVKNAGTPSVPLTQVRLRSPALQLHTVRDFMIFEEHATAQSTSQREEAWYRLPIFYLSSPLCIFRPDDHFPYPSAA